MDPNKFFGDFPPLKIEIGNQILDTPISNYFWKLENNTWALGIVRAEMFGFPMSILGSIWMNNFDIVFDRDAPKITIYDIERCSTPNRLLTENDL